MAFDIDGARKAGYSDADIADHLAQTVSFDATAARKAGYTAADIIEHLAGAASPTPPPKPAPADKPVGKPSLFANAAGFMSAVNRGLVVGDEMAGALGAAGIAARDVARGDFKAVPSALKEGMAAQRRVEDGFAAAHPNLAALGRGAGTALTMIAPVGPTANALAGGTRIANAARGAIAAGTAGAAASALDRGTAQERLQAASQTATNPLVLGLGAAGGALVPAASKPKVVKAAPAPTLDELTAAKNAAYKAVDDSGVTYKPEAIKSLAANIQQDLTDARLNPKLHPKASAMLDDITGMAAKGDTPTITQLDQLRQVVRRDVASSPDNGERFMGKRIIDQIDNFIGDTTPAMINGANGPQVAATLAKARDLNTKVVKLSAIQDAGDAAERQAAKTGSGGNFNNATRQQIDRAAGKVKNWTPDEQAAIDKVVLGTPTGNVLRTVGKLSPEGNGLMLAGHLAAAVPTHGVSAVTAFAGAASKAIADAMTSRNVDALVDLISRGGDAGQVAQTVLEQRAAIEPRVADLYRQVSGRLSRTSGFSGGTSKGPPR